VLCQSLLSKLEIAVRKITFDNSDSFCKNMLPLFANHCLHDVNLLLSCALLFLDKSFYFNLICLICEEANI